MSNNQTPTQAVMDNLAADEAAKANRTALAVKLADQGEADARIMIQTNAEADASVCVRAKEILKARALELQGDESRIRDYLSGYRKAFPGAAKVRASEAGAILRAYSKSPEKLEAFTGGYHALVSLARDVNGRQITKQRTGGTHAPTDKGMDAITEKISVMKPAQVQAVVNKAVSAMIAVNPKDWELHIVRQIDTLCVSLEKSKQPIYSDLAVNIMEFCSDLLNSGAIAHAKETAEAHKVPGNAEFVTEHPAEEQQAA